MTILMPDTVNQGRQLIKDDHEVKASDNRDQKFAKIESHVARNVGGKLTQKYPGRQWRVEVDAQRAVVIIQCPSLSMEKGYVIYMKDRTINDLQEVAVKAAAEIMERYGLGTGRLFIPESVESLEFNSRGEAQSSSAAPEKDTDGLGRKRGMH